MKRIKQLLPISILCAFIVALLFIAACGTKYTVKFDSDGGTEISSQTVDKGSKASKPDDPTKVGYTFDGWYLANGTEEYNFDNGVTSDITLTAKWTVKNFTVTFNYNDGVTANATATVQEGATITQAPTAPVKVGYEFTGWNLNNEAFDLTTPITADITLVAQYKSVSTQLTDISVDTNNVKTNYAIGEDFNSTGLVVSATYNTLIDGEITANSANISLTDTNLKIDSTAYDKTTAGSYTIYIGYTVGGITRYASYAVMVTSSISGVHGIELEKDEISYPVAVNDETPVAVALNDLHVYTVNADGTKGSEITSGLTYSYYLGNKEVTAADLTNKNAYKYQIWVSVPYTSGNETYNMTDFVIVTIVGNEITSLTLKTGTQVQAQSYTDSLSSTWVLTAKYSLTGDADIDLSNAQKGTGANQYTVSNLYPAQIGAGTAKVTYYYLVGTEIYSYEGEVDYCVTPATADGTYSAIVDVNVGTADGFKDTATNTITKSVSDGAEIVPGMIYSAGSLSTNTENKDGANGEAKLYGRVQFTTSKGITVYAAGPATLTFYARYGSSSGDGSKFVLYQGAIATTEGATQVAESELVSNKSKYQTVTVTIPAAGVYTVYGSTGSLNTFAFSISGKILAPTVKADIASLTAGDVAAETAIGTDGVFSIVASSSNNANVAEKSVTVAGVEFTKYIDLKGAGKGNDRTIKVTVTEAMLANGAVVITAYVNHGGAGQVRQLGLYASGKKGTGYIEARNVESTGTVAMFTITEAGDYYLGSASSGMNILSLSLTYDATTGEGA
jgi:uncharacterized repeat protein (TIGR02543 family)